MLGASPFELAFAALLLVIVLLAQIAPRLGELIGARYARRRSPRPPGGQPPS